MEQKEYIEKVSKTLLSLCDRAQSIDNCGFNGADAGYMHWINQTFFQTGKELPDKSVEKIRRILIKYKRQIEAYGFDYSLITKEYQVAKKQKKTYEIFGHAEYSTESHYTEGVSLKTEYNDEYKNEVKSHKGRWDAENKVWVLPLRNLEEIEFVEYIVKKYNIKKSETLVQKMKQMYQKFKRNREEKEKLINMSAKADAVGCANIKSPEGVELYPYQKTGVKWIETVGNALIADDMGIGKTAQALSFCYNNDKFPVLIIVPACVKLNWKKEIKTFCNSESVHIISGKKEKYELPAVDYYIINYDIVSDWVKELTKLKYKILIMDEVHYIKTPTSKRSKACIKLAKNPFVQNVVNLSGTPMMNRPVELLPILKSLNISHPDLMNDSTFKMKYCYAGRNRFGVDFNGAQNLDELNILLRSTCMIRRLKRDVLTELPSKVRSTIPMEISNRKIYSQAEFDFIKWYREAKNKDVHPQAEALVRIEQLKQLAFKGKYGMLIKYINDTLDSVDKIVVVANHIELQEKLYDYYKDKVKTVKISGGMKAEDKSEAEDSFQNGDARIMVLSLKAGGVGINLQKANTMIICELGWTPADMLQVEDRIHRIGSTETCNIYYLIAERTIEDYIMDIIMNKQQIIEKSIDGMADESSGNIFGEFLDKFTGM